MISRLQYAVMLNFSTDNVVAKFTKVISNVSVQCREFNPQENLRARLFCARQLHHRPSIYGAAAW
jgi:hypothetical protein